MKYIRKYEYSLLSKHIQNVIDVLNSSGVYFETEKGWIKDEYHCILVFLHVDDFRNLEDDLNVDEYYLELGNENDIENEEYPIVVLIIGSDDDAGLIKSVIQQDDIENFVDFEGIRDRILNTKKFNV